MAQEKKLRGKPIVLPLWWLAELRTKFSEAKERGDTNKVKLAAELTTLAGRRDPWDHKAVERFLNGKTVTVEMMWAFLDYFPSLVQPVFWASSEGEAKRLLDLISRGNANPDWKQRYRELEAKLLELAEPVRDQTSAVASLHEQATRSRKPGSGGGERVGRGRS